MKRFLDNQIELIYMASVSSVFEESPVLLHSVLPGKYDNLMH